MTQRLAETTRRIASANRLEAVVTAMRGISASRAGHARVLMGSVRSHAAIISRAIGEALLLAPPDQHATAAAKDRRATVVFCAEQGFTGAFSERVLQDLLGDWSPHDVFLIGTRGAALAREHGLVPLWQTAMVVQASLVPILARRIVEALYDWISTHLAPRLEMIVPSWSAGSGVTATTHTLLPFDFQRFGSEAAAQPPLTTLSPAALLGRLAEEYVFAAVCEAALASLLAENEARVAAMQAARTSLQGMVSDLQAMERLIRQDEITAEVIELATSARANRL
jgi:F-type H+-transporting ATPase subunit gamma